MDIINKTKSNFNEEIYKIAKKNIVRKLAEQGIDENALLSSEFDELVAAEVSILESDTKKVGSGILIGIALTMLTGF